MKLTKKEFKKFNNYYMLFHYILPAGLSLLSLIYLFGYFGDNLLLIILSCISMLYYIFIMVFNNLKPKIIEVEIDKDDHDYSIINTHKTANYETESIAWFIASLFLLFILMITLSFINIYKDNKWSKDKELETTEVISELTEDYLLTKEDSINIIELAKMAELECASNFSDSLLKLEKSKPNRFEMQDIIQVIFNRVDSHHPSFKNTIYEVLRQDKQFQPYTSGKFDDYHCSNESIRITKENYILWKTTGHGNSLLPKTVIGFCSAEYAESVNVVNVWNGWKRVEGKSLRVSANGMRLHYFYSIK